MPAEEKKMAENTEPNQEWSRRLRDGFTLLEVMVSTLVMGLVLVGAMTVVGGVFRTQSINGDLVDAPVLASQLLNEVTAVSYEDPDETPVFGHEGGEAQNPTVRADYDDVDDYDGWTASPPQLKDGTELTDFAGWSRSVAVSKVPPGAVDAILPPAAVDTGLRRITVTITDPYGGQTIEEALRSSLGAVEQRTGVDTTLITYIRAELQIGQDTPNVVMGKHLVNHAEDQ